jgi:hypothetical protein
MKNVALALVVLQLIRASVLAGTYSGGTGEPNDPYRIATANDLNDIGNHPEDWYKYFTLTADINLADYNGTQFNIIGGEAYRFAGIFDGNDHTIMRFSYKDLEKAVWVFLDVSAKVDR